MTLMVDERGRLVVVTQEPVVEWVGDIECSDCPFATNSDDEMAAHVAEHHSEDDDPSYSEVDDEGYYSVSSINGR